MPAKNKFFNTIFSVYYFLKVDLHHFSKIKCQKESQKSRNQSFSYYFCMMIEGSGSGSIPLTSGSGSGSSRPKNMWIRIRNTGPNITRGKTCLFCTQGFCEPNDGGYLQELSQHDQQHPDARDQDVQRRAQVGPRAPRLLLRRHCRPPGKENIIHRSQSSHNYNSQIMRLKSFLGSGSVSHQRYGSGSFHHQAKLFK